MHSRPYSAPRPAGIDVYIVLTVSNPSALDNSWYLNLSFIEGLTGSCGPSITYSSLYKVFVFVDPLSIYRLPSARDDVRCHKAKHS